MNTITATLSNLRQSPRKVRVVANLVRGKKVEDAIVTLEFAPKRASLPLRKLIASAIANAKAQSVPVETLFVKRIEVNEGKILYRRRPVAHGSAHPIRKRTSHVFVALETKTNKVDGAPKAKIADTESKPKAKKDTVKKVSTKAKAVKKS